MKLEGPIVKVKFEHVTVVQEDPFVPGNSQLICRAVAADIATEAQVAGERRATVLCIEEDDVCHVTIYGVDIGAFPSRDRDRSIAQHLATQRGGGGGHLRAWQVGA